MNKTLTPTEALQAIVDGKTVEVKFGEHYDWRVVKTNQMIVDVLINTDYQLRLAQGTITIGDVIFPEPVSEPLEIGQEYFICDIATKGFYDIFEWENRKLDQDFLKYGMIHLTKENAIAHAKALIKLSGGNVDE